MNLVESPQHPQSHGPSHAESSKVPVCHLCRSKALALRQSACSLWPTSLPHPTKNRQTAQNCSSPLDRRRSFRAWVVRAGWACFSGSGRVPSPGVGGPRRPHAALCSSRGSRSLLQAPGPHLRPGGKCCYFLGLTQRSRLGKRVARPVGSDEK